MVHNKFVDQQKTKYFQLAAAQAKWSLCLRRRCGAVIIKDGTIIGRGYNAPPQNNLEYRRCDQVLDKTAKYPTDKTCCVHAEVRAIQDVLAKEHDKLEGADLFFASVGQSGEIEFVGEPYCTICSKMALDVGIARFWLWHESGPCVYSADEYHEISRLSGQK